MSLVARQHDGEIKLTWTYTPSFWLEFEPLIIEQYSPDGVVVAQFDFNLPMVPDCFLTTAMVDYYGKSDNGPELMAMRTLRSHSGHKYPDVLDEYHRVSLQIIQGIEQSGQQEYYYGMIKNVVENIVAWVANEEWQQAEHAYLNLYNWLKNEFQISKTIGVIKEYAHTADTLRKLLKSYEYQADILRQVVATINPNQDYDIIHTLTFSEASGDCPIRLYRGSLSATSGTVYYRAGTSGDWTTLSVSGTSTTFPVTDTTMQVAHNWNKSGNNYMTPSFRDATNITSITISQKAPLTGTMGDRFMYAYAYGCSKLTSLAVPDTSGLESVGNNFMYSYARGCSSLTSLAVPDTSGLTSVGNNFMYYYAGDCSSLTSLAVPDTSSLESVGYSFMAYYANSCSSLTSLAVPDTSSLESVGDLFMSSYAYGCSSLTELVLPAVGWFENHNVSWNVPSGRLGSLKGRVLHSDDLNSWKALTAEGKTLYTNYIRDPELVYYMADTWRIERRSKTSGTWGSWAAIETEVEIDAVDGEYTYEDDDNLTHGTTYQYRVKHVGDDSDWLESNEIIYSYGAGTGETLYVGSRADGSESVNAVVADMVFHDRPEDIDPVGYLAGVPGGGE